MPIGQAFYRTQRPHKLLSSTLPMGWFLALHSLMNFVPFLVGAWSTNICSTSFPLPPEPLFEIATALPLHHPFYLYISTHQTQHLKALDQPLPNYPCHSTHAPAKQEQHWMQRYYTGFNFCPCNSYLSFSRLYFL